MPKLKQSNIYWKIKHNNKTSRKNYTNVYFYGVCVYLHMCMQVLMKVRRQYEVSCNSYLANVGDGDQNLILYESSKPP